MNNGISDKSNKNSSSYQELVQQAQSASEDERRQLVDTLVSQFTDAAYHWALIILQDEEKAADALQEAWLTAFLHLNQLRESAAFPAWFRQLVVTSCYHAIRSEKPSISLDNTLVEDNADLSDLPDNSKPTERMVENVVENNERSEHIREAMLELPEHERIVTELYYFGDIPQQEIAEVLAVPVTTVKKRLQYARRHLKGLIQPEIVARLYALNGGCNAAAFDNLRFNNDLVEPFIIHRPDC